DGRRRHPPHGLAPGRGEEGWFETHGGPDRRDRDRARREKPPADELTDLLQRHDEWSKRQNENPIAERDRPRREDAMEERHVDVREEDAERRPERREEPT